MKLLGYCVVVLTVVWTLSYAEVNPGDQVDSGDEVNPVDQVNPIDEDPGEVDNNRRRKNGKRMKSRNVNNDQGGRGQQDIDLDKIENGAIDRCVSLAISKINNDCKSITDYWDNLIKLGNMLKVPPRDKTYDRAFKRIFLDVYPWCEDEFMLRFLKHAMSGIDPRMGTAYMVYLIKQSLIKDVDKNKIPMFYHMNYMIKGDLLQYLSQDDRQTFDDLTNQITHYNGTLDIFNQNLCITSNQHCSGFTPTWYYVYGLPTNGTERNVLASEKGNVPEIGGISWRLESEDGGKTVRIRNVKHGGYMYLNAKTIFQTKQKGRATMAKIFSRYSDEKKFALLFFEAGSSDFKPLTKEEGSATPAIGHYWRYVDVESLYCWEFQICNN